MTQRSRNLVRPAALVLAAIVASLTFAVVGHAVQTISTPNSMTVAYTLAAGAVSVAITPPVNLPVFVMADQIGVSNDNVGSSDMTVVSSPFDGELVWNGIESNKGGLTAGFSPTAGTHIMFIDFGHLVQLEVNNATSFRVHNLSTGSGQYKGNVTLIW